MCLFVIFENLFSWLFTQINLVYWYFWYSFNYYLALTSFTSSFITDINGYFEIPTHPPFLPVFLTTPFIKFNKDFQPPFILTLPFIKHLRVNTQILRKQVNTQSTRARQARDLTDSLQWCKYLLFKNDEIFFCFTLKALFVFKVFTFLSWLYWHAKKQLD